MKKKSLVILVLLISVVFVIVFIKIEKSQKQDIFSKYQAVIDSSNLDEINSKLKDKEKLTIYNDLKTLSSREDVTLLNLTNLFIHIVRHIDEIPFSEIEKDLLDDEIDDDFKNGLLLALSSSSQKENKRVQEFLKKILFERKIAAKFRENIIKALVFEKKDLASLLKLQVEQSELSESILKAIFKLDTDKAVEIAEKVLKSFDKSKDSEILAAIDVFFEISLIDNKNKKYTKILSDALKNSINSDRENLHNQAKKILIERLDKELFYFVFKSEKLDEKFKSYSFLSQKDKLIQRLLQADLSQDELSLLVEIFYKFPIKEAKENLEKVLNKSKNKEIQEKIKKILEVIK